VISSETAAGLSDFTDELRRNPLGYHFSSEFFPAAMQGARTAEEISGQLRKIGRRRNAFDAIVLVRGGGGKTDLAVFDDESLCRALAAAPLPVVTGIGHEVDHPVAERVVHRSCKTPTAAAGFLIECVRQQEARVVQLGRQIQQFGQQQLTAASQAIERRRARVFASANLCVQREGQLTTQREREIRLRSAENVQRAWSNLSGAENLLAALRPETTLARGFALVSQQGKLLTDAKQLRTDLPVEIRLSQGRVQWPPA
jgi:exodeoxyribonuclease VII large subunit